GGARGGGRRPPSRADGTMTFALGLALIAPALGLAGAFAVRSELLGRRCLQGGALVAAAAWAALVGDGSGASVGAFHAGPLAAAAGCGAALSLVAVDRPARLPRLMAGGMTLLAAGLAVTNGHAELQGPALALAVAVAAVGGAAGQPRRRVPPPSGPAAAHERPPSPPWPWACWGWRRRWRRARPPLQRRCSRRPRCWQWLSGHRRRPPWGCRAAWPSPWRWPHRAAAWPSRWAP